MLLALSSLFVSLAWRAPNVAVRHSTAQRAAVTMRDNALLIGGASKTRAVGHPQGQSQLPEFLLSRASDASLLGAGSDVSYQEVAAGLYECEMPAIKMLGFTVSPVLTVRLERDSTMVRIRVVSAHIYLLKPGSADAQLLQGAAIESANTLSWTSDEGGWLLTTDLTLRVAVELPRGFLLPRVAVDRPASAVLRRVCAIQCEQFLHSLERSFEAWATQGTPRGRQEAPQREAASVALRAQGC